MKDVIEAILEVIGFISLKILGFTLFFVGQFTLWVLVTIFCRGLDHQFISFGHWFLVVLITVVVLDLMKPKT